MPFSQRRRHRSKGDTLAQRCSAGSRTNSVAAIHLATLLGAVGASCAGPPRGSAVEPALTYHAHRGAFGSDTATVDRGTAEVEFGTTIDPGEDRVDTPMTIKWGATDEVEIYTDLTPYQLESRPGGDADGFGDLGLGVRYRFLDQNGGPSAAVQLATRLPTGDEQAGLSSGEVDYFAAGILTKDFDTVAATAFYELGVIGDQAGGTSLEHSLALVVEKTVGPDWGVFGETVTILEPEADSEALFAGLGASFNMGRNFAGDVGASVGLNEETPDLELFFGLTWAVGTGSDHRH